jgi:hypothetical protein
LVLDLPQPTIRAMMCRAIQVQGACMAGLLGNQPTPAAESAEPDKLLTAKDAAVILAMSPLTLLRSRQRAPYRDFIVPTGTRGPRFSLHRIQQHIAQQAGTVARRPSRDEGG